VPLDGRAALSQDAVGLHTCTDNGDHCGDEDADDGDTRHKVELAPFTVVREHDRRHGNDEAVVDTADLVVAEGVERALTDENVRAGKTH